MIRFKLKYILSEPEKFITTSLGPLRSPEVRCDRRDFHTAWFRD